jgi:hypothetical protein
MGYPHKTLGDRIEYDPNGGCWLWSGSLYKDGYGRVTLPGSPRHIRAHRAVYEAHHGPIQAGLVLDHLCRVRCCVNPAHLEPVTVRENTLRGVGPASRRAKVTHCPAGHPYSDGNVYAPRANGTGRACRICTRHRQAARRRAAKAQRCQSGAKPCVRGASSRCDLPRARND